MLGRTSEGIRRVEFPVPLNGPTEKRRFRMIVQGPPAEHGAQHAGGVNHQLIGVILNRSPEKRAMGEIETNAYQSVQLLIQLATLTRGKSLLASPETDKVVAVVIFIVPESHLILNPSLAQAYLYHKQYYGLEFGIQSWTF